MQVDYVQVTSTPVIPTSGPTHVPTSGPTHVHTSGPTHAPISGPTHHPTLAPSEGKSLASSVVIVIIIAVFILLICGCASCWYVYRNRYAGAYGFSPSKRGGIAEEDDLVGNTRDNDERESSYVVMTEAPNFPKRDVRHGVLSENSLDDDRTSTLTEYM